MQELIRNALAYTAALGATVAFLVKVLHLPVVVSGSPALVNEYYGRWWEVFLLDWVLVAIYIAAGSMVSSLLDIQRYIGSAIAALIISGLFLLHFLSKPASRSFFSRWFHKARWGAVGYDIILVSLTAAIYSWVRTRIKTYPKKA